MRQRRQDRYERCARDRLEPILGPLRCIDPGGGPDGAHDFEADLDDGGFAAIEVTGEVESGQRALESLVKRLPPLAVSGSRWQWLTGLDTSAREKRISSELPVLLSNMGKADRRSAHCRDDYRDPLVRRLRELGVEFVYAWVPTDAAHQGRVIPSAGTYGGWGWGGAATDAWLAEFLASPRGINKVVKLRSVSRANQWHLVIVLDPRSKAGMGITMEESWATLPTLEPPEPLTHLWLLPMPTDWPGLRWARGSGWSVLTASRSASAQRHIREFSSTDHDLLVPADVLIRECRAA
jgi:hypothetical protein